VYLTKPSSFSSFAIHLLRNNRNSDDVATPASVSSALDCNLNNVLTPAQDDNTRTSHQQHPSANRAAGHRGLENLSHHCRSACDYFWLGTRGTDQIDYGIKYIFYN